MFPTGAHSADGRRESRADECGRLQRPPFEQLADQLMCGRRCIAERAGRAFMKVSGHLVALQKLPPKPNAPFDFGIVILRADAINAAMAQLPKVIKYFHDVSVGK